MMASASCCIDFFHAVSVGSLDDLYTIRGEIEPKKMSDLAQSCNEMGETPLLMAINKRHLHVVKFLVDVLDIGIGQVGRFSWKGLNYLNVPPLFAAIISDQMSIIKYLIETRKVAVNLDSFMKDSTTVPFKMNILELIGAAYILHAERGCRLRGLSYWKKAETLRHVTTDGNPLNTMALEEAAHISKYQLVIKQALFVSRRVLKQLRLFPNIYIISNFSKSWMFFPSDLHSRFRTFDELPSASNISMYILKQLNNWWGKNSASDVSTEAWDVNKEALNRCWIKIGHQKEEITPNSTLLFQNFMFIFSFACEHLKRIHTSYWPTHPKDRTESLYETTNIVCDISISIMRMLSRLSSRESKRFKQSLAYYIHLYEDWETDKPNLFHRACRLVCLVAQKEPNYAEVIQLFLESGANPNAVDAVDGNIPLHCLLPKNEFEYWLTNPWDNPNEKDVPIIRSNFISSVQILLDAGSHVDQSNRRGETVLELLKRNRKMQQSFKAPFDPHLQSVINGVLPLSCYCAKSIRKSNIPIVKLPPTLQLLVRRH